MDRYVYTYSDAELQRRLAELQKKGLRWKDPVQRYKGLGEMDADQLAETTMDPRHRTLRRVGVGDAGAGGKGVEVALGRGGAPRKDFILAGGTGEKTPELPTPPQIVCRLLLLKKK